MAEGKRAMDNYVQVGQGEDDSTFELIRRVETYPFLNHCYDLKQKDRDSTNQAWNEISDGLMVDGKEKGARWCRAKWTKLKNYYYKVKRGLLMKETGNGATNKKLWTYYNAMDRVLSSPIEFNENTRSNFPEDDPDSESSQLSRPPSPKESTDSVAKRKRTSAEIDERILKFLEEPEEVKDVYHYFGMTVSANLRSMPPRTAHLAMMRLSTLMYEMVRDPNLEPNRLEATQTKKESPQN